MPRVNVIIPNLNGEKLLPICLESLRKQEFRDFDITVVDNGSKDGSLMLLKDRYPEVRIISLEKNYGFAGGVNRGIEATDGEFIALLNNDIEVDPGWLEELHRVLMDHLEVGSCQAKLMRYWERKKINGLGIRLNMDGEVEIIGWGEVDRGQYEEEKYIFCVGAGASLYRRQVFEDIGIFDEKFFANFEDVDIGFRAQLAGFKAMYAPKAVGYHMVGRTIKRRKYLATYLNNRNKVLFFWKNMPDELIKKYFRRIFWHRWGRFLKRILFNFYKIRTYYFLKGTFSAYIHLPYILRERKRIKGKRRASIQYLESMMDRDFL